MPDFSPLVERIAGKGSTAWDIHFRAFADEMAGKDVVIMSVGDPDFPTPEPIIDAAIAALRAGDTHYAQIPGRPSLRKVIAEEVMRVSGVPAASYTVTENNVMVLAGTQNALFASALCLLRPGDEIIALDPMYVTYEATWRAVGAEIVKAACPRETGFRPDIDAIREAVTEKTRAIVFANPNNPTGVVLDEDELEAIAEIAIEHDLWVIADEVYAAQTFEKPHHSIAALPGMAARTVTCGSLSKSQAMTGWRIGWIVGPEQLIRHCENLGLAMLYGIAGFIQTAAIEALTGSRGEMARMLEIYRRRRDRVAGLLGDIPGLAVLVPEAGMFVLVDVSATGLGAGEFAKRLYEAEGVSVLDGAAFGDPAAKCVRISFTASEERLAEGCRRIARFCAALALSPARKSA